ncbi:MAG TPA: hypothetical protein DCQ56_03830 [Porphyromonadaceae bacterium]|nr:hypothetical protein [Porphyromonadaceae bacterium]
MRTAMETLPLEGIMAENRRRNEALASAYDPLRGIGCCGARVDVDDTRVPRSLLEQVPHYAALPALEQARARIAHDFEYWAATCATIRDKLTAQTHRFVLNRPQRRLLAVMERQRTQGLPIRVIVLKARQWGCSTLVQMYMAWIQMVLRSNWNSFICGHLRITSQALKRMYALLLRHYPPQMLTQPRALHLKSLDGSQAVLTIEGMEGSLIILGSARSEDAVRGYDLAMAHLSEVAFWPHTAAHSPHDLVRSVQGTIAREPCTLVAMESTANGVGQFFHTEWLRAKSGDSDKVPVFVPWHEIEIYRSRVDDAASLWQSLDDYERALWNDGCTLEQINWYHQKRREYSSHDMMMAEFPSNDIEAFANTGRNVFDLKQLDRLRATCRPPLERGDVEADYMSVRNVHFVRHQAGLLQVWRHPDPEADGRRYVVVTDVGGRSAKADYSVITVWDCGDLRTTLPEVAAQWRGHIDHDLLAWKSAQVATYYRQALLAIESNTLETEQTEGAAGEYILADLLHVYPHLYSRSRRVEDRKLGFQTNRKTKREMIYRLIRAVRDLDYVERDHGAVDEMATYELTPRGQYAAMKGRHDDILMTRAIGLVIIDQLKKAKPAISEEDKRNLSIGL